MTQPLSVADATNAYQAASANLASKEAAQTTAQAAINAANLDVVNARVALQAAQDDLFAALNANQGGAQ